MKGVKFILGLFLTLLILTSATLFILSMWDIHVISWDIIYKIIICGAVAGVAIFLLWIVKHLFFKKGI